MRFDFGSFLIGALFAFGLAFFAYKRRAWLSALWLRIRARFEQLKNQLTAGVEQRYQTALLARCDELMLSHTQANFDDVYVAQKFDPPLMRPSLNPIDPEALRPINISIALRSAPRLVVLGRSGAGRTILLAKLARDYINKRGEAAYGTSEHLPVLLHLAEIDWSIANDNDPLPPLLQAATAHVTRLIAPNVSNLMRGRIRSGAAILLLDGFDEIAGDLRPRVTQWLAALLTKFPNNLVVITSGPCGYGALQDLGCAPLQLAAWTFRDVELFTQRWINVIGGGRQDRQMMIGGLRQMSGLTPNPLDLTLAVIDWQTRQRFPTSQVEEFDHWLERVARLAGSDEVPISDKLTNALGKVAWTALEENRLDVGYAEVEQAIANVLPATSPEAPQAAKVDTPIADLARAIVDRSGLFIPFGMDAYTFAHRRLAAYLAARYAAQLNLPLDEHWDQAEWTEVFDFYAGLTDAGNAVVRALNTSDDLSRTHLWAAARWTGYAAPNAAWRSRVMSELARVFLQPDQYKAMRECALGALFATHDKGLPYLLKRSFTQTDPAVRALSLRGLGMLGREADLPIFNAALKDQVPEVRISAIRAIGAMARSGSGPATQILIRLLLEQDEEGQRVVAELLADCGEEGHQILREAATEEDIKVRRAATFGLAAAGTDWARELLQKMEREEQQWYVRTAALDALNVMQARARKPGEDPLIDLSPVVVDQQGWLVEWAAQQGLGIGVGRQAVNALMRALDDGAPNVRQAALQTLRHTGNLDQHDKLRAMLNDSDPSVREAAFLTLETIGQRAGQPIPR